MFHEGNCAAHSITSVARPQVRKSMKDEECQQCQDRRQHLTGYPRLHIHTHKLKHISINSNSSLSPLTCCIRFFVSLKRESVTYINKTMYKIPEQLLKLGPKNHKDGNYYSTQDIGMDENIECPHWCYAS